MKKILCLMAAMAAAMAVNAQIANGSATDGTETGIVAATDTVPALGIQLKAVWREE